MSEVVVMGNVVEKYYTDNIYEVEREKRILGMTLFPEVVERLSFTGYTEITRSEKMSKHLTTGDSIYFAEDNFSYEIKKVSYDLDGNTVYFINKNAKTVEAEIAEITKEEAQKRVDEWLEEYKKKKIADDVKKETSKMDRFWKWGRE